MQVGYHGEGSYELAVKTEGESLSPHRVMASGQIQWEEKEGVWSMRLQGTIKDHQVSVSVAVVDNQLHLFTMVCQ